MELELIFWFFIKLLTKVKISLLIGFFCSCFYFLVQLLFLKILL